MNSKISTRTYEQADDKLHSSLIIRRPVSKGKTQILEFFEDTKDSIGDKHYADYAGMKK